MNLKLKRIVIPLIGFGLSFAILYFLFRQAWESDQFDRLTSAPKEWGLLILGLVAALMAIGLTFVRWFFLVRALDLPFRLFDAFRLGFIGYFLNFFTVGIVGGDTLKAIFLANQIPDRKTHAVASVVIDRVLGLFALFLLTAIATLASGVLSTSDASTPHAETVRVVCGFAIALTIGGFLGWIGLQFANRATGSLQRTIFRIPLAGGILERLHTAAVIYQSRQKTLVGAVGISLIVHVMNSMAIFLIASGLPGRHPDVTAHLVIVPMSMVAGAIPLPGGLGSFEWSLNFLYQGIAKVGAESENGLIVAFGFRLITLIIAAIGVVFYFASKSEMKQLIGRAKSERDESSARPAAG